MVAIVQNALRIDYHDALLEHFSRDVTVLLCLFIWRFSAKPHDLPYARRFEERGASSLEFSSFLRHRRCLPMLENGDAHISCRANIFQLFMSLAAALTFTFLLHNRLWLRKTSAGRPVAWMDNGSFS